MKKLMNWMNKPITWSGYFKYSGIMVGASLLYCIIWYFSIWGVPNQLVKVKKSVSRLFRKNE